MSKAGCKEMADLEVVMDKHAIELLDELDEEHRQIDEDIRRQCAASEKKAMALDDGCASNGAESPPPQQQVPAENLTQEEMDVKQKEQRKKAIDDHMKSYLPAQLERAKLSAASQKELAEQISKELGLGLPLDLEAEVMKFTVESMLKKFGQPSTPESREEILNELLKKWEEKEMERPRSQSRSHLMFLEKMEKRKQGSSRMSDGSAKVDTGED